MIFEGVNILNFSALNLGFVLVMLLGGGIHVLATLAEQSKLLGVRISIKDYRDAHPYKLTLGLFTSIACLVLFNELNQLNMVSAFMSGYLGDSIIKKIANTTQWGAS